MRSLFKPLSIGRLAEGDREERLSQAPFSTSPLREKRLLWFCDRPRSAMAQQGIDQDEDQNGAQAATAPFGRRRTSEKSAEQVVHGCMWVFGMT
jgi:hypothetical protein